MRKKHIDPAAGQRLSEIRQHRGISQRELAKAIAVTVGTIQGYEHARIAITATRLEQLARALQCETADLAMPPGAPLPRYRFHSRRRGAAMRQSSKARVHAPNRRILNEYLSQMAELYQASGKSFRDPFD